MSQNREDRVAKLARHYTLSMGQLKFSYDLMRGVVKDINDNADAGRELENPADRLRHVSRSAGALSVVSADMSAHSKRLQESASALADMHDKQNNTTDEAPTGDTDE